MKICNYCKKEYDDTREFCMECGHKLTSVMPSVNNQTHIYPTLNQQNVSQNNSNSGNTLLKDWLEYILSAAGILVWWNLSELLGLAMCYVAVKLAWTSHNQLKKVVTIIIAVIASIVSISLLGD